VRSLEGLYLTSFDAQKIKINKKVKYYYEALTLYHESKKTQEEVYIPVVVSRGCDGAESVSLRKTDPEYSTNVSLEVDNVFTKFQYVEPTNVIPLDESSKL